MAYGVKLLVWGDYACFTRPEMKVERVSYEFMTPSAARGVLEAIYWKPQMTWVVDRIHVLNPIRKTHVRRNEISDVISERVAMKVARDGTGDLGIDVERHRQQRAAAILRDVRYGIEAHVELRSPGKEGVAAEAKHLEMFKRRATRGQCFHRPYLGNREFPAHFELVESIPESFYCGDPPRDLGLMLHDLAFEQDDQGPVIRSNDGVRVDPRPRFFYAVMTGGIVEIPPFGEAPA